MERRGQPGRPGECLLLSGRAKEGNRVPRAGPEDIKRDRGQAR